MHVSERADQSPLRPGPTWCYAEQPSNIASDTGEVVYKKRLVELREDGEGMWLCVSSRRELQRGRGARVHVSRMQQVSADVAPARGSGQSARRRLAFSITAVGHDPTVLLCDSNEERERWVRWLHATYPHTHPSIMREDTSCGAPAPDDENHALRRRQ